MANRNNLFSEIIVGAFMVMVLLALVVFTALTAGIDFATGRGRKTLTFAFSDVAGLRAQDSVIMRGMPVGKVRRLTLNGDGVLVEALVDDRVTLREDYTATVRITSILGGNHLALDEGIGRVIDTSETHYAPLPGTTPRNLMVEVEAAVGDLRQFVGNLNGFVGNLDAAQINGIIADIGSTTRNLDTITTRLRDGEGTIGKLLSSDDTLYKELGGILVNVREFTTRLNESDGSVARLLFDNGELYDSLASTLRNLDTISTRLRDGEGTLGKFLSDDDTIYNDIAVVTAGLRQFVTNLGEGGGTLGKLISDPSLYNNAEGLILDARSALDNFRETTPLTTFGGLLMGGL